MTAHYTFDHSADEVFALLTDPDFLVERGLALGEKDIDCEVEEEGRKTTVILKRTIKRDLPKVLAKLFGDENTIEQTELWETVGSSYLGSYTAEVHGQPVTLSAKFKLKPAGEGCEFSIDYKCKASTPVVGIKVEAFIMSQTEDGMIAEMDYLARQLNG
ncbi:MAG: DUF2505 domain-containing protein [Pseudomonadales bacterium]|nr:DUF2505 domain-containing protein [Pseudomonadales bacterium]